MSEGGTGKTGPSCSMWAVGFILALGAGLWTVAQVLS